MDRAGHILIAFFIAALLGLPAWRLKVYSRSHGHTPLAAITARTVLSDAVLFTWAWAWFGLLNLRIIIFFIVVQVVSFMLIHLLWRAYTPQGVEWRYAYLRMYGELRYARRWLFILLNTVIIVSWIVAAIALYGGFIVIYRHPSYPSLFAVMAVSSGLSLAALSAASVWMLIHPALEDEARARLLLDLCNGWIIVFVCTAMAGIRTLAPVKEVGLLPRPYHLQFPLSPLLVAGIVLAFLSFPMFLGGNRRTGEIQKIGRLEQDVLGRLARVNSPVEKDKVSSFSRRLEGLRERQQSFQHQIPPPGMLILGFLKEIADDSTPDTEVTDTDEAEQVLEKRLSAVVANRDKWMTISDRDDRIREFGELAAAIENSKSVFAEEMNVAGDDASRLRRFGAWLISFIFVRPAMIILKQLASITRGWKVYLEELQQGDYRWRHLAWLETVIAYAEDVGRSLSQISGSKGKEKYLSRGVLHFSEKPDVVRLSADDTSSKKRFGALMVLPFVVPVIMAVATPLIQAGLGLKH